jgi:hypothetical protein
MSVLLPRRSAWRLPTLLGLVLVGLAFVPSASSAAALDTVTATGGGVVPPPFIGPYSGINISAQSGTSGQNPSGSVSFMIGGFSLFGPVTCLSVTGPDQGAGTPTAPTTAVLNFDDLVGPYTGINTLKLVDNGGNGADMIAGGPSFRSPTDCSLPVLGTPGTLTTGRAVVFDARVLPTSIAQCMNGGWKTYGVFTNQGLCVAFVASGGKAPPSVP